MAYRPPLDTTMRRLVVLALLLAVTRAGALDDVGRGQHRRLYLVPRPGPVILDGRLDDWDSSGRITVYGYREAAPLQSARLALMHDADALYISADVRDTTPLTNRHDPRVEPQRGWDADACRLGLSLDPDLAYPLTPDVGAAVRRLDLWYFTDRAEPCLALAEGTGAPSQVVPSDRFEAAYRRDGDGIGYTFEYRIPWSTLGARRPLRVGDLVAGAVQFCWGTPDGLRCLDLAGRADDVLLDPSRTFEDGAGWGKLLVAERGRVPRWQASVPRDQVEAALEPAAPLPLSLVYDLPEDADVTIQLQDAQGWYRRILVPAQRRPAGRNDEPWDGCDDQGLPLPAGTYRWKGLYHYGIHPKFRFSVHNSGQTPYRLNDGTGGWGGDTGTPTAVAAAGSTMLLAWSAAEIGSGLIGTTLSGQKLWGSLRCPQDLAADAERVFAANTGGPDGQPGVQVLSATDGRPLLWGNGRRTLAPPPGAPEAAAAGGVATAGGKVFVSWPDANAVAIHDATSGERLALWPVPAPRRLAARVDGAVAVISEGRVLALDAGGAKPWLSDHLDQPRGLAIGRDGTLFVSNGGALQNVSVFAADGRYLRSIGAPGGRPREGRYVRDGMLEPGGIALSADYRLWVAETLDSPKRVSVWDAASGGFVREFFGAASPHGRVAMDPARPTELSCDNVLWRVNWRANACEPVSTLAKAEAPPLAHSSVWLDRADATAIYRLWPDGLAAFGRWSRDGKLVWGYDHLAQLHEAADRPMGVPGRLDGLTLPLGVADGYTGVACRAGPSYLFTTDGLYVAMVMRNGHDSLLGADITAGGEAAGGQLVKPAGLGAWFLLGGDQDGRVTELDGLQHVHRLPGGTVTLTPAQASAAREARARWQATLAKGRPLSLARGREGLASASPIQRAVEVGRGWEARAAYDATNLYLRFRVTGSDLVNAATDPTRLADGGNCLELQIAANPTPLRLLVTRRDGQPLAVLYRPQAEIATRVGLDYAKSVDGFVATVTMPLDLLGLSLRPGDRFKLDLGYLFGNGEGTAVVARSYWVGDGAMGWGVAE